jgi:hypothetical protein
MYDDWCDFGEWMKCVNSVYFSKKWDDASLLEEKFVDYKKKYKENFVKDFPKYSSIGHRKTSFTGFVDLGLDGNVAKFIFEGKDRYTQIDREDGDNVLRYSIFINDGFTLNKRYFDKKINLLEDDYFDPDFSDDPIEKILSENKMKDPTLSSIVRYGYFNTGSNVEVKFQQATHDSIYLTFFDKTSKDTIIHVDISDSIDGIINVDSAGRSFYDPAALSDLEFLWNRFGYLPINDVQSEVYLRPGDFEKDNKVNLKGMDLDDALRFFF